MLKNLLVFLFLLNFAIGTSQNGVEFKVNKQLYLKGNSAIIGNTILGVSSKKAHNSFKQHNDVLELKYTDVDKDRSTFNSSQAELKIPENKKIKYAVLYWSAVYRYDVGEKTDDGKYINYSEKRKSLPDVNKIYFKTPNSKYQNINGQVVFDSKKTELFKETQPYLCYADVTSMLQDTNNVNGVYTVANIKATQGFVSGGGTGGWLLYLIYENEEDSKKYFTTYNGFIGVDEESLTIDFLNFKTNETGAVKSSILLGALEGDQGFNTDECAIIDAENQKFITLFSKDRKRNNFFNSRITSMDSKNRNPSSINTLGLDILKMPIPNTNNKILNNNSTKTKLKLSTKKDGFYLFFVAFETEISETFIPPVAPEILVVNQDSIIKTEDVKITSTFNKVEAINKNEAPIIDPETTVLKENSIAKSEDVIITDTFNKVEETNVNKKESVVIEPEISFFEKSNSNQKETVLVEKKEVSNKITVQPPINLPAKVKTYILITNVFANMENAIKWQSKLNNDGYNAQLFVNPVNNWYYIYIAENTDLSYMIREKNNLLESQDFKDLFVKGFYLY